MSDPYTIRPLDRSTWAAFARLVEDNNGVYGCWCTSFHPEGHGQLKHPQLNRRRKLEGKGHRRAGVAAAALNGALGLIASLGGGRVEGYPEPAGAVPASFMYNGALSTYEDAGFARQRKIGKHRWVVSLDVAPRSG